MLLGMKMRRVHRAASWIPQQSSQYVSEAPLCLPFPLSHLLCLPPRSLNLPPPFQSCLALRFWLFYPFPSPCGLFLCPSLCSVLFPSPFLCPFLSAPFPCGSSLERHPRPQVASFPRNLPAAPGSGAPGAARESAGGIHRRRARSNVHLDGVQQSHFLFVSWGSSKDIQGRMEHINHAKTFLVPTSHDCRTWREGRPSAALFASRWTRRLPACIRQGISPQFQHSWDQRQRRRLRIEGSLATPAATRSASGSWRSKIRIPPTWRFGQIPYMAALNCHDFRSQRVQTHPKSPRCLNWKKLTIFTKPLGVSFFGSLSSPDPACWGLRVHGPCDAFGGEADWQTNRLRDEVSMAVPQRGPSKGEKNTQRFLGTSMMFMIYWVSISMTGGCSDWKIPRLGETFPWRMPCPEAHGHDGMDDH